MASLHAEERRLFQTRYWALTLPAGWTNRLDKDGLHVLASPKGTITIRVSEGIMSRVGIIDEATMLSLAKEAGSPEAPAPLRLAGIDGLGTIHTNNKGGRTHNWLLRAGRLLVVLELESTALDSEEKQALEVLSTLTLNHA